MMRTLAIDPGLARIGWAVIEFDGNTLKLIECGLVETPKGESLPTRLSLLSRKMGEIVERFKIDSVAVEELFFSTNAKTAIDVAQARGVLLMVGNNAGLPVYEYTPNQVKQAVTSNARADKFQVGQMVKMLLCLPEVPKPDDVADACALGICHCFSMR